MTFGLFVWFMIFAHFVGDYVLKSEYLSKTKGEEWYNMLVHCMLYTGSISLVLIEWTGGFPVVGLLWIFVTHWFIDSWKCKGLANKFWTKPTDESYLYADQAYHFIALGCVIIWYGWFG